MGDDSLFKIIKKNNSDTEDNNEYFHIDSIKEKIFIREILKNIQDENEKELFLNSYWLDKKENCYRLINNLKENELNLITKILTKIFDANSNESINKNDKEKEKIQEKDKDKDKFKDKKTEGEKELPGLVTFFLNNWKKKDKQKGKKGKKEKKNFFKKIKNVYSNYKEKIDRFYENYDVYDAISLSCKFKKEFLMMLTTSCIIATFGLFQNSAAVIIGAMIIAPLMMPILGFSLGIIWGDRKLIFSAFKTLFIGSAIVLIITSFLSFTLPGIEINQEILNRTNPTFYDIIVALASGFIGAYSYVNPKTSSTLAGVAIAVALMPPLCTVGIGLGQMNLRIASGAFILYLINLISISISASIVFWRLKVHPISQSKEQVGTRIKRNLLVSVFILLIISAVIIYFGYESYIMKEKESNIRTFISQETLDSEIINFSLRKAKEGYDLKITIVTSKKYSEEEFKKFKDRISNILDNKVKFQIRIIPVNYYTKNY